MNNTLWMGIRHVSSAAFPPQHTPRTHGYNSDVVRDVESMDFKPDHALSMQLCDNTVRPQAYFGLVTNCVPHVGEAIHATGGVITR